jgi:hypothetical protein
VTLFHTPELPTNWDAQVPTVLSDSLFSTGSVLKWIFQNPCQQTMKHKLNAINETLPPLQSSKYATRLIVPINYERLNATDEARSPFPYSSTNSLHNPVDCSRQVTRGCDRQSVRKSCNLPSFDVTQSLAPQSSAQNK